MTSCLGELRRIRPSLDMQGVTPDKMLFDGFGHGVKAQLDPIWNTLGSKTKQLVNDIRTLQQMMKRLHKDTGVDFHHYLQILRKSNNAFNQDSHWIHLDATDDLVSNAKARVYVPAKKGKRGTPAGDAGVQQDSNAGALNLEAPPKWQALQILLDEIAKEVAAEEPSLEDLPASQRNQADHSNRTIIFVDNDKGRIQLEHLLREGPDAVLAAQYNRFEAWKVSSGSLSKQGGILAGTASISESTKHLTGRAKRRKLKQQAQEQASSAKRAKESSGSGGSARATPGSASSSGAGPSHLHQRPGAAEEGFDIAEFDAVFSVIDDTKATFILPVHTESGSVNRLAMARFLDEMQPRYIIMYEPDLRLLRQIEIFRASRPAQKLRCYSLQYKDSLEEQRYLTSMQRERAAFESLIGTKRRAVFSTDQDGRDGRRQKAEALKHVSNSLDSDSRDARRRAEAPSKKSTILVDMREFRSSLPPLIHEHGMEIMPLTLTVGDYILSPTMCVERKSVPDLIGSLNSGRLYDQCQAMIKYYACPVLLIEFDPTKAFAFLDDLSGDIEYKNTMSKLVLTIITFPKLRILWSKSPEATAQMFKDLKRHQQEPDPALAQSIGSDESNILEAEDDGYAIAPKMFLSKLPGITAKNIRRVLEAVPDIHTLANYTMEQMTELLGKQNGKSLFDFFHQRGS